jgi:acetolactate synthase-1/2/3 large subunit
MTVADVLLDALIRAGVIRLFVAPGIAFDHPLLIRARARDCAVTAAGTVNGAALMAAVTGEMTDAPGVALVPAGADVTDAVAGAARNRAPLLVAAEVPANGSPAPPDDSDAGWKGRVVIEPESAGHWAAHACQLALGFPRGPVRVTWRAGALAAAAVPVATAVRPPAPPAPDTSILDDLADRLAAATRPVIVVGMHARGEAEARWLRALAEALPAPVLLTLKARGVVADPHPLALGPYPPASVGTQLLRQADLILAVGVDGLEIGDIAPPAAPTVTIAPGASPEPSAPRGHAWAALPPALEVVGDIALVVEELAPRLRGRTTADWDVAALDRMKRLVVGRSASSRSASALVRAARDLSPAGSAATADAAVAATVADGWQSVAPHDLLTALPPSPPGFAVAAAVAFALARPGHAALAFTDAAGVAAGAGDVAAAMAAGVPLAVLVLNPRGEPLAICTTATVAREHELSQALARTLVGGLPAVIDCRVEESPTTPESV